MYPGFAIYHLYDLSVHVCLVAQLCLILWPCELCLTRLFCPWDSPGKIIGVGCRFLLQGIFLTQRSNLGLLHWQAHSLPLSHMGSPVWPKTGHLISQSLKFSISKKWVQNLPHWIIKIKFCDVFITLSKHCTWSIVWWGLKKWCLLLYYFLEWKRFWVDVS